MKADQHNLAQFRSPTRARISLVFLMALVFGLNGAGLALAQTQPQPQPQTQTQPQPQPQPQPPYEPHSQINAQPQPPYQPHLPINAHSAPPVRQAGHGQGRSNAQGARKKTAARPNALTALLARGAALHREGKVEEAEAIFRDVLAHDPRNVDAFYDLGAIAEGRGDLIGALSDYRAALALRAGDRELQEAVTSTEATLKKSCLTIKHDEHRDAPGQPVQEASRETRKEVRKEAQKASPMGLNPPSAGVKELDTVSQTLSPAPGPAAEMPVGSGQDSEQQPSGADADLLAHAGGDGDSLDKQSSPIFSVPQADAPPSTLDSKTFSLSSRKGAIVAPSVGVPLDQNDVPRLGISPDQFPEPSTLKSGTKIGICPPPPVVGQAQTSNSSNLRRGAAMMLTIGAGMVLGGALHCPICHMMSGHF